MPKLEKWTYPQCYRGESYLEYYVFLGKHRDSEYIDLSNFEVALKALGGENPPDVIVVRSTHWAVGWVEQIMIHESCKDKLESAQNILDGLEIYPILDDMHYSNLRYDDVMQLVDDCKDDLENGHNLDYWKCHGIDIKSSDDRIYGVCDEMVS